VDQVQTISAQLPQREIADRSRGFQDHLRGEVMKLTIIALITLAALSGLAVMAPPALRPATTPHPAATQCALPLSTFCKNLIPMED
jgi:hypothetical protein